jgi:hypothetical protein
MEDVQLLIGGKAPLLVLGDADIEMELAVKKNERRRR